jgi:hypothetical protein
MKILCAVLSLLFLSNFALAQELTPGTTIAGQDNLFNALTAQYTNLADMNCVPKAMQSSYVFSARVAAGFILDSITTGTSVNPSTGVLQVSVTATFKNATTQQTVDPVYLSGCDIRTQ